MGSIGTARVEDAKQLGYVLRQKRRELGHTQLELGCHAGVDYTMIANKERGNFTTITGNLIKLFDYLDVVFIFNGEKYKVEKLGKAVYNYAYKTAKDKGSNICTLLRAAGLHASTGTSMFIGRASMRAIFMLCKHMEITLLCE